MQSLKHLAVLFAGTFIVSSYQIESVLAADDKYVHGGICIGFSDGGRTSSEYDANGVENTSSTAVNTFVCPIVRDDGDDPLSDVDVNFNDASSSYQFECTLAIYDVDGDFLDSATLNNGSASVVGEGSFNFGAAMPTYSGADGDGGFYVLYCSVTPLSKVYGFHYADVDS
jgi:hypothetical protein